MTPALLHPGCAHFHPRPLTVPIPFVPYTGHPSPLFSPRAFTLGSSGVATHRVRDSSGLSSSGIVTAWSPSPPLLLLYALATVIAGWSQRGSWAEAAAAAALAAGAGGAGAGRESGSRGALQAGMHPGQRARGGDGEQLGGRAEVSLGARRGRLQSMLSRGTPGRGRGGGGVSEGPPRQNVGRKG